MLIVVPMLFSLSLLISQDLTDYNMSILSIVVVKTWGAYQLHTSGIGLSHDPP